MEDAEELRLVRAALADPLSTSVRWASGVKERMSRDPELNGLQPKGLRDELRTHAKNDGKIVQKIETCEQYKKFKFCYEVLLDFDFIIRPVYVEIRYVGLEDEFPQDLLVSVHTSFKSRS